MDSVDVKISKESNFVRLSGHLKYLDFLRKSHGAPGEYGSFRGRVDAGAGVRVEIWLNERGGWRRF